MRICFGINLRKREINRLEQHKTAVAASPMPIALETEVVVAKVGHMPSSCTKVGFWSTALSLSCFKYLFMLRTSLGLCKCRTGLERIRCACPDCFGRIGCAGDDEIIRIGICLSLILRKICSVLYL